MDEAERLIPLAVGMARRAAVRRGMIHIIDDLVGLSCAALVRALDAYDPAKGELKPFVTAWVAGEISNAVRKEARRTKRERPLGGGSETEEVHPLVRVEELGAEVVEAHRAWCIGEEARSNGEAQLIQRDTWQGLQGEIERLEPEDLQLVRLRYWESRTWKEVGAALGIGERAAWDRDAQIREQLREALLARERLRPLRRKT
jgi:RNA polymerase sigma factor (sigma-70 family)